MMDTSSKIGFPPEIQNAYKKARKLEWLSVAYLISVIVIMYLVMGSSQAMKTAWIEDILSLIPAIAFLISSKVARKEATRKLPYGYHRAISIAYLCAALALLAVGALLVMESAMTLIKQEHPSIGSITLAGNTFWLGWLMIPAALWSGLPAVFLGLKKIPLAKQLHDKVLYADALMNKADWLTSMAAVIGVLGVAWGYWWLDATAAIIIALDVVHDGYSNLVQVVKDLMDEIPKKIDQSGFDPITGKIQAYLMDQEWIADVNLRLREHGHVFFGEAFIVPKSNDQLTQHIEQAIKDCKKKDWRLQDLVLTPISDLKQLT